MATITLTTRQQFRIAQHYGVSKTGVHLPLTTRPSYTTSNTNVLELLPDPLDPLGCIVRGKLAGSAELFAVGMVNGTQVEAPPVQVTVADLGVVATSGKGLCWNAYSPWNTARQVNERQRIKELTSLSPRKIPMLLRMLARWLQLEPTNGDFTHFAQGGFGWDGMVREAYDNGYEIALNSAGFIPAFAQSSGGSVGIPNPAHFADYLKTVASRYAPGGSFVASMGDGTYGIRKWIIENEANLRAPTSQPAGVWTPVAMVNTMNAVYAPLKAVHPDVTVLCGAIAQGGYSGHPSNANFINQMFQNGLAYGVNTDAVLINVYTGDDLNLLEAQIAKIRNVCDTNGQTAMPIWVTEYGLGLADTLVNGSPRTLAVANNLKDLYDVRLPAWRKAYNCPWVFVFSQGDTNASSGLRLVHSSEAAEPIQPPFSTFADLPT